MISRFHRRFAVSRVVTLSDAGPGGPSGLLYELSQGGCRVSNLDARNFAEDDCVKVHVPGFGELEGRVRRASDGAIALRYLRPLQAAVLDRLVSICRTGEYNGVVLSGVN